MQLTTGEAALEVGCEPVTIRQNIRRGNLKAKKKGRDYLIERADFDAWAANRKQQPKEK